MRGFVLDPFAPPSRQGENESVRPDAAMSLLELNLRVKVMLRHTLPGECWITAEISELRVASNGHCYLELVQKDDFGGSLVARAKANIWRSSYNAISGDFLQITGRRLEAGIKVMLLVEVTFHEVYGYALNVVGIEPNYTLGDLERRRREIIRQLEEDGVMELNKELPLPRVIRRVAVISAAGAAGYGDFCNQLAQSGYRFTTRLFEAAMQGERVESSVIAALDSIAAEAESWDVVVIIRGGGATTDLGGFDSYLLASNVAQFPLPVLTGIGHERDDTIIDLVAHTRLKTPTAVAAFLIDRQASEAAGVAALRLRLAAAVRERLAREQRRAENIRLRLTPAVRQSLSAQRLRLDALTHRYELCRERCLGVQRARIMRLSVRMEARVRLLLLRERQRIGQLPQQLRRVSGTLLLVERQRQESLAARLAMHDPARILALGYSMTLRDGRPVRDAAALSAGDVLVTRLAAGMVESVVSAVSAADANIPAADGAAPAANVIEKK